MEQIQGIVYGTGIPLGGLGAGNVEIRADGSFHEWFLFPILPWTKGGHRAFQHLRFATPVGPEDALFALWLQEQDKKPTITMLRTPRFDDEFMAERFYFTPGIRYVPQICYNGEFPFAFLEYLDPELPIEVKLKAYSPFIPHDSKNSGLPVAFFTFTVHNPGDQKISISLLANFLNPAGWGVGDVNLRPTKPDLILCDPKSDCGDKNVICEKIENISKGGRINFNRFVENKNFTCIGMYTTNIPDNALSYGNTSLACLKEDGIEISYQTQWQRRKWDFPKFWHEFSMNGTLPNTKGPEKIPKPEDVFLSAMTPEGKDALFKKLLSDPVIATYYKFLLKDESGAVERGEDQRERIVRQVMPPPQRVFGALAQKVVLAPRETRDLTFIFSWYFPNLPYKIVHDPSQEYKDIPEMNGRMYTNWFANSTDAVNYAVNNFNSLYKRTKAFHSTLYNTSLDHWLVDVINTQTTIFSKISIWSEKNEFSMWDGMGCCGSYAAGDTPNMAAMIRPLFFPDLALRSALGTFGYVNLDLSAGFFERQDNRYWLPIRIFYEYKWLGDEDILKKNWRFVTDAYEFGLKKDKDGDGVPECSYIDQMYDQWPRYGTNAYVGSLWICYLHAAIEISKILGKTEFAENCSTMLIKAEEAFDQTLWNGQYYNLCNDLASNNIDNGCEISQVHGQWLAEIYGIGDILPPAKVRSALKAIYQYNRHAAVSSGQSVRCGSWPVGGGPKFGLRSWQWGTAWTRSEFALASHLIYEGMTGEGKTVLKDVYERHKRIGMDFNHVECGSHYSGALDSWMVHLSMLGFQYDGNKKLLELAPRDKAENFNAFLPLTTGWGSFTQDRTLNEQNNVLKILEGKAELNTLILELPEWALSEGLKINVFTGEKSVEFKEKKIGQKVMLNFESAAVVKPGADMYVHFRW